MQIQLSPDDFLKIIILIFLYVNYWLPKMKALLFEYFAKTDGSNGEHYIICDMNFMLTLTSCLVRATFINQGLNL